MAIRLVRYFNKWCRTCQRMTIHERQEDIEACLPCIQKAVEKKGVVKNESCEGRQGVSNSSESPSSNGSTSDHRPR